MSEPVSVPQLPEGLPTVFPCQTCGKESPGNWCGIEHMVVGTLLMEAQKPVRTAKKELAKERQTRRGPLYKLAMDLGILDIVARGDVEFDVAHAMVKANYGKGGGKFTVSKDAFRRAVNERKAELNIQSLTYDWEIEQHHIDLLGPSDKEMQEVAASDSELFESMVDEAVAAFVRFREEFFETPRGLEYLTKPHHARWIGLILRAIYRGDRQMILSPPRSGKTDLLIHFGTWSVIRNPNIRIMWVGASQSMAEKALDAVRMQLEDNEPLIAAYLPPGITWKPSMQRGGGSLWSRNEFTVSTRTVIGSKSPTMVAVGSGGKILSRDTDLIVLDDIEDSTTVQQPGRRESTRTWLDTTIESRKERETALFCIGSRQHYDDLYAHLVENKMWLHTIESAHDLQCALDPDDMALHTDCMLFPEKLDYEFLMEKKESMSIGAYEMQYLNRAVPTEGAIFPPDVVEACFNLERPLGVTESMSMLNLELVAGLDPAVGKTQAALLWGLDVEHEKLYLIDMSYGEDGGLDGAKRIMAHWAETYGLRSWFVETNGFQKGLYMSDEVKGWAREHGISMRAHQTGVNKWDDQWGIVAMRPLFEKLQIDLPYGSAAAIAKTSKFRDQLVAFTDETIAQRKKNVPVDTVMAAWFPLRYILRQMKSARFEKGKRVQYTYDESYPMFSGGGGQQSAPWESVYPS